jgi:AraC-like DNA-binding protein
VSTATLPWRCTLGAIISYFEPGATATLLQVPAIELTDQVVDLEQLWGTHGARLDEDLAELDEVGRVDRLEAELLGRVRCAPAPRLRVDVVGLARWVRAEPISMTVCRLAGAAGVSRQHLTRVFRQVIGVSPKRYCRLARFQAGLIHAGAGADVNWAEAAAELGYSDQSHMIAEFRELSSLTPESLATQRWFHPFILDAQSRTGAPTRCRGPRAVPFCR